MRRLENRSSHWFASTCSELEFSLVDVNTDVNLAEIFGGLESEHLGVQPRAQPKAVLR